MPVAEALARVLADAAPLAAEPTPLTEAHGRVLAADVAAVRSQPPADVSAMDGYAARSADVARTAAQGSGARNGRRIGHARHHAGFRRNRLFQRLRHDGARAPGGV